jgi:hypothetical protein
MSEDKYPLCRAAAQVLKENHYGVDEYDNILDAVVEAFDCNQGCLSDEFWPLEDLDQGIIRKYKVAIRAMLRIKGYPDSARILVEPCCDDSTNYMAFVGERTVLNSYHKPWHFGHCGGIDELEEFFQGLLNEILDMDTPKKLMELGIEEWIHDGYGGDISDLCVTVHDLLEVAGRRLDKAYSHEIMGEILFKAEDGKYYVGHVEFTVDEANRDYLKRCLDEQQWVIREDRASIDDKPLFWNKDTGWGDLESATVFSAEERHKVSLPKDSFWLTEANAEQQS